MPLAMLRDDSIHVSGQTRRALSFLPRTEDRPTTDAWAEAVLSEWLAAHYPDIVAHVEKQKADDDALRERLKGQRTEIKDQRSEVRLTTSDLRPLPSALCPLPSAL